MKYIQKVVIWLKCVQWKAWMAIFATAFSVLLLAFSGGYYEKIKWFELVVLPMLISFFMGVGVSCWFTYRSDSAQFDMNLEIELDIMARKLMENLTQATLITSNAFFDVNEKTRQLMHCLVLNQANTYYIEVECAELFIEYNNVLKKNNELIQKLSLEKDNAKFCTRFNEIIDEIAEGHHRLLAEVLSQRDVVFQRRRKKEKWIYKNNRIERK